MSRVLVVYREENEVVPYQQALIAAGVDAELARVGAVPGLRDFEGLLLTGGPDVDPALYGEARRPETEEPDRERDEVEIRLVREALDLDLPLLAICRGLQLLNVFHGGSLIQHLETAERHLTPEGERSDPVHTISIEPESLLHSIAQVRQWRVNSRHHQAAARLGRRLRVTATDPEDGTIEALERPGQRFVLGVQWHPENQALVDSGQLRIFQRFGESLRRQPEPDRVLQDQE